MSERSDKPPTEMTDRERAIRVRQRRDVQRGVASPEVYDINFLLRELDRLRDVIRGVTR